VLFPTLILQEAFRRSTVGDVAGVATFQSQNVPTHGLRVVPS
jgi:hypothetical protein